jgi:hypothetical protein
MRGWHGAVVGTLTLGLAFSGCGTQHVVISRPTHPIYAQCGVGKEHQRFDARQLLGRSIAAGRDLAQAHGCEVLVVEENGHFGPMEADLVRRRIDVVVVNGKIVDIRTVG